MKDKYISVDEKVSTSRRTFVKKTVYTAPSLVILGTLPVAGWESDSEIGSPKSSPISKQSTTTKNSLNNSQNLNGN